MKKNYILRLTDEVRKICDETIGELSGMNQNAHRARILRQGDADGPNWTAWQVVVAFHRRARSIQNVRRRYVTDGFSLAREGRQLESSLVPKLLDGEL